MDEGESGEVPVQALLPRPQGKLANGVRSRKWVVTETPGPAGALPSTLSYTMSSPPTRCAAFGRSTPSPGLSFYALSS